MFNLIRILVEAPAGKQRNIIIVGFASIAVIVWIWGTFLQPSPVAPPFNRVADLTGSYDLHPTQKGVVAIGQTLTSDLAQGETDVWTLDPTTDVQVTISLTSDWPGLVELGLSDALAPQAQGYNDLGGGVAIICNKNLSAQMHYRVVVSGFVGATGQNWGHYKLSVLRPDPIAAAEQTANAGPAVQTDDSSLLIVVGSPCS